MPSFLHEVPCQSRHREVQILLVDNNLPDIEIARVAFHAAGLIDGFRALEDGEEALAYLHKEGKYADVPTPDIIILDLVLPMVSGLDVLKSIKTTTNLMHIPVIVSSGCVDPEKIRAVYALHGNCYMGKPLDLTEYLRFIQVSYDFWTSVVTLCPPTSLEKMTDGAATQVAAANAPLE